jgi:hypothetical protein
VWVTPTHLAPRQVLPALTAELRSNYTTVSSSNSNSDVVVDATEAERRANECSKLVTIGQLKTRLA